MRTFFRYWLPLFAYAVAILVVSLCFRGPADLVKAVGDKPLHALEYGLLAVLALRALGYGMGLDMRWAAIGSLLLVIGFGLIDEFAQSFNPARSSDPLDVAADVSGGVIGTAAYLLLRHWLGKVAPPPAKAD